MKTEKLKELYEKNTKHSNYQILPKALKNVLEESELNILSRHEAERMQYFTSKIDFKGKRIFDIGANTGFFTFESIDTGATSAVVYEGNTNHSEFIEEAAKIVNYPIQINHIYYDFEIDNYNQFDVVLLLNIVHHFGDDYGENTIDKPNAKKQMLSCINNLSFNCHTMIFQMGFNWKGNRHDCLFNEGTKKEQIEFIKDGIKSFWEVEQIGVAEKNNEKVVYIDLNENNINRDDSLGEFLNRPIIILKSLRYNG